MSEKRRRWDDEINVRWNYAWSCLDALKAGRAVPPIPTYTVYETDEASGVTRPIDRKVLTDPARVEHNGQVFP